MRENSIELGFVLYECVIIFGGCFYLKGQCYFQKLVT